MASEFLSDTTSKVLAKTLDAASVRQRAIANNIANVETPGYKRSYVTFEAELKRVLDQRAGYALRESIDNLVPLRKIDDQSPARPDGNNVNIDAEIADLAETALEYRAAMTLMSGKNEMLRAAITEGKK